jgi:rsbT co-antagonist protein RsbR
MKKGISEIKALYGVTDKDVTPLLKMKEQAENQMDEIVDEWYDWLKKYPEFEEFFDDEENWKRVVNLQKGFWKKFFNATFDEDYFNERVRVGQVHARIGLPQDIYLAGVDKFLELFVKMLDGMKLNQKDYKACRRALNKMAHMDMMIIVQSYEEIINSKIAAQTKSLMEMSTPVTQLWTGLLFLPVVGLIDSKRAQDIMNNSLNKISETNSQCFILDISGVSVVDTAVANHLIKITKATRLMGCESIISGVSPSIAQTIVELGIEIGDIRTTSDMKGALERAFSIIGMDISN